MSFTKFYNFIVAILSILPPPLIAIIMVGLGILIALAIKRIFF